MKKGKNEAKERKPKALKKPSLFKRTWKTWIYNVFFSGLFFGLWAYFYTLDDLAFEFDWFLMWGIKRLRWQLFPTLFVSWFAFRQIFKDINLIIFTIRAGNHDEDVVRLGGYKRGYDGTEGTGKTLNTTNDVVLIAADKDYKMRLAYYLKYPFREDLKNNKDYKVLKDSYYFYNSNPDKIPHLMANYDITYDGRSQYDFDMGYLDQEKRLAEGYSLALTELANLLPNSQSRLPKDEKKDTGKFIKKNETLSLSRQWFDLTIVADEQRFGEVFIGFRSVTANTRTLTDKRAVLKPHLLEKILKRIEKKVMKRKEKTSKFLSKCYTTLLNFVEDVGFYVFSYFDKDSITGGTSGEEKTFVLACDLPFIYDTRNERKKYKLYGEKPEYKDKKV